ncbi:paired amphipathic helix protein Sin3a-like [Dendronephthya gigantea]|uniref:paired amphipathic helix protein Sin3a-like n=1 Tax=Dendronephthya gigantea TaxID=151771 RepID=UPI00106A0FFB|nr:paired amphipathic helix protein Sin3a-like [Dendronephthya gigantea]XP_028417066.1 paired amphipathic helix protein Sin3a-like [Dendronephthya gigantea]
MKRTREEHEKVYGQHRAFSHPVLAPAPVGLPGNFDPIQENIAVSMGQYQSNPQIPPQNYPVAGPAGPGQGHSPLPSHPQAHIHPPGAQAHMQGPGGPGQQQFQRLKVEDALSYLDQVKMQFGNQPQVYNDFLDIMKEFKSQSIDTPGVISRVSNLFKGHPELIVGFNTFLPPGYKIEVHPNDANSISYTTPHQTTLQKTSLTGQSVHTISLTGNHGAHNVSHVPSFPLHPSSQQPQQQQASQQPPTTHVQQQQSQHQQLSTLSQHATSQQQGKLPTNNLPQPQQPITHQNQQQPRGLHSPPTNQNQPQQPVEFNHAINYVNKIKTRFQGQPDTYKAFLEILHTYQKEQKNIKDAASQGGIIDPDGPHITEQEMYVREAKLANDVYKQVAKLFKNQEDLLQEFSQFLPDANGAQLSGLSALSKRAHHQISNFTSSYGPPSKKQALSSNSVKRNLGQIRRSSTSLQGKVKSKSSGIKEISLSDPTSFGSVAEFAFFDKVRKALRSQKVYEDFLRCLKLFNQEVISRADLVQLVSSFLGKFPELFKWFKEFLGYKDSSPMETPGFKERTSGELAHLEIDYSSCKRCGTSYRALPKSYTQPKCSGRTALCREVLNDTWVSFPSWSEDTTFLGTKKTQYEEYIFRCEDERFELDGILEVNLSTIRVLEAVQKKLNHMTSEEQQKFRLDSSLGGMSEVIHKKAIQRIYGDKAPDIIDGLKKTPAVAVPLVLKRLKIKEEEWRAAQRLYNKTWRDQNEKYYLKSLDYQGMTFKQNDLKAMRSKSLVTEIENIYDEKQEQAAEGNADLSGPHMIFTYKDKSILDDAAGLIVHHMKRQTGIHKEDKSKIKSLLSIFVPDLFFAPRGELSDDEDSVKDSNGNGRAELSNGLPEAESDDAYNLYFVNNNWYIFLRLHQMLCERLLKMYQRSVEIAEGEASDKKQRKESTAVALRLKAPTDIDVEEYYPAFLDMVRNLLDGNMEMSSFEDTCREMFGVHAYIVFTIDKLVQNIVRQLQTIVVEETCVQVKELYQQEQTREGAGGNSATQVLRQEEEMSYQKKAETLLNDECCYKFIVHKDKTIITISIELIETEDTHSEDMLVIGKWNDYVDKYVINQEIPPEVTERLKVKPIFLPRTAKHKRSKTATDGERTGVESDERGCSPSAGEGEEMPPDIVNEDGMECKISSNSYKLEFVAGGLNFFYRKKSLPRARQNYPKVTRKLTENFQRWLESWAMDNVSREQKSTCDQWLVGHSEGLQQCTTAKTIVRDNFKSYTKYLVEWPAPPVPSSNSTQAQ